MTCDFKVHYIYLKTIREDRLKKKLACVLGDVATRNITERKRKGLKFKHVSWPLGKRPVSVQSQFPSEDNSGGERKMF